MIKFMNFLTVAGAFILLSITSTVNAQNGEFDNLLLDGGTSDPFIRLDQPSGNDKFIVGSPGELRFYDGNSYSLYLYQTAPSRALVVDDTGTSVKTEVKIERDNGGKYVSFDHPNSQSFGVRSLDSTAGLHNGGVGFTTNTNLYPLWVFDTARSQTLSLRQEGVGIGTYDAQVPLHIFADNIPFTGDPTLRLDNATNAWDISTSGMGKFRLDDATNTKTVLTITPISGNLGVGTTDAMSPLHVVRDDGTGQIRVDENSAGNNVRTLFNLACNTCTPGFRFGQLLPSNQTWFFRMLQSGNFSVDDPATTAKEAEFRSGGDLKIGGNLIQASSRDIKNNIVDVDTGNVLAKLDELPIHKWTYNHNTDDVRHMGPMAEDFYNAFGLGDTNKGISSVDTAGVAFAAIKALNQEKDAEIAELKSEIADLKAMMVKLMNRSNENNYR